MVVLFLEDFRNPPEVNIRCHYVLFMASFILYLFNFPDLQRSHCIECKSLAPFKNKGTSVNKPLKKKNFASNKNSLGTPKIWDIHITYNIYVHILGHISVYILFKKKQIRISFNKFSMTCFCSALSSMAPKIERNLEIS